MKIIAAMTSPDPPARFRGHDAAEHAFRYTYTFKVEHGATDKTAVLEAIKAADRILSAEEQETENA